MNLCQNCGHPRRCFYMNKCIMGVQRPPEEAPEVRPDVHVNTTKGSVLVKSPAKKAKKKAK
ncbi:MAG: hypothetical protein DWQ28_06495 [Proteobacteria bacterium]|nr:MAG: hypothetical protein DWQ28_06190 [Pseudomonadota bacterium]REJ67681.1 MAG: hypothetical protein DWQ28_06495 [Pseudomonadota bacterium]